jgi:hypothetical protein
VVVTFVVVGAIVAVVRRLGLVRLWFVIDCAAGTQRFAFPAPCAPYKLQEWGINCLFRAANRLSGRKSPAFFYSLLSRVAAADTPTLRG